MEERERILQSCIRLAETYEDIERSPASMTPEKFLKMEETREILGIQVALASEKMSLEKRADTLTLRLLNRATSSLLALRQGLVPVARFLESPSRFLWL